MAVLALLVLILAMAGYSDASTWCICKTTVDEQALQKAIDYACGNGADCTLITQNGACYQPNTVRSHCSYAVNSYFQKKSQVSGSCNFEGVATVYGTDPSSNGCTYPSSGSASSTPIGGTPTIIAPPGSGTGTGTGTGSTGTGTGIGTSTGFTPSTPTGIIGGGMGSGLGPSGTGINTDSSNGGIIFQKSSNFFLLVTIWFSGLVFSGVA